jgi:hypothetical protein
VTIGELIDPQAHLSECDEIVDVQPSCFAPMTVKLVRASPEGVRVPRPARKTAVFLFPQEIISDAGFRAAGIREWARCDQLKNANRH